MEIKVWSKGKLFFFTFTNFDIIDIYTEMPQNKIQHFDIMDRRHFEVIFFTLNRRIIIRNILNGFKM